MNKAFEGIIGQESTKSTLQLYIDAYKETERLPSLLFQAQRGGGKSFIVRKFREALRRKDGSKIPILEVNCATIKNAKSFFDSIAPVWVEHSALLFLDEVAELPHDLQSIFLTLLEVKPDPIRRIEFDGIPYTFDFTKVSLASATTDGQKLLVPLQDRLRAINLEEYNDSQLLEIFEKNLNNDIEISDCAKEEIKKTFRGNPRDVVLKTDDLKTYCAAKQVKTVNFSTWRDFMKLMGVGEMGLSFSEIQVLKAIGKLQSASLTDISSITGFDRSLIQRSLEGILVRKGLMTVDGKRKLSASGYRFYHSYCVNA